MGISQWYKCIRSRSILKKKRVFYEWINVMSSVRVILRWKNTKEAVSDVLFLEWSFRLIHSGKGRGKGRGQTDLSLETPAVAAWRAFRDPSAWNVGNESVDGRHVWTYVMCQVTGVPVTINLENLLQFLYLQNEDKIIVSELVWNWSIMWTPMWSINCKVKVKVLVAQSCPTVCESTNCSPPDFSVRGIFQARMLEWVAIPFSRGSSWPQGSNLGLLLCRQALYHLSHQGLLLTVKVICNLFS